MAKKRRLFTDKTEIIAVAHKRSSSGGMKKDKMVRMSLTYDQIKSIRIEKYEAKKLFRKFEDERILIYDRKSPEPYQILKHEEKEFFDEYKREINKFAQDNRVLFSDETVQK